MKRVAWTVASGGIVALAVYLVACRWADVGGNLEAQVVITAPAFVAHHLLIRRHTARLHAETRNAIGATPPADR